MNEPLSRARTNRRSRRRVSRPAPCSIPAIGIFLLLVLSTFAQAEPLSPAAVKNLLQRIREKRVAAPNVQADFREERMIHFMNKPVTSSGKVWFQAPDKFRREVKGNAPSVAVSDGKQLWIYYPNFKSAEHYSLGKRSPIDAAIAAIDTALNLGDVEGTFNISAKKIENGYQLEMTPRSTSMKRMFRQFDVRISNDLLVTHTEMLQPDGDRIVTDYSNQSRAPIPTSTFEFTPPPGTQISTPLGR
jgi:outer membrane lipoprotein carrier protein